MNAMRPYELRESTNTLDLMNARSGRRKLSLRTTTPVFDRTAHDGSMDDHRWVVCPRSAAFTLVELLVVISIIGTLAGLVVGLAPTVSERMKESRIKSELAELQVAIDAYKAKFGIYPPDNGMFLKGPLSESDTEKYSALNPLYYELGGVFVDNVNKVFLTADTKQQLSPTFVAKWFNRDGFVNAVVQNKRRPFTHRINDRQHAGITRNNDAGGLEILAVGFITDSTGKRGSGFTWPTDRKTLEQSPNPIPKDPSETPVWNNPANEGMSPWHYVSSNPIHNPEGYDLWAEYFVRGERRILANWKQ